MSDIVSSLAKFRKGWHGGLPETVCGSGSTMAGTKLQRGWIPGIVRKYGIRSIADIGCGDLNWFPLMNLDVDYQAFDLVPRKPEVQQFDLVRQVPPAVDLILCLWVLNHLPFDDCEAALANLKASGAQWLMITDRPKWHNEQPKSIQMDPVEELLLKKQTGDRIILVRLNEKQEDSE